ncbi:hypothetical protein VTI74DRAFT_1954 [Chaetomium olivicolor]
MTFWGVVPPKARHFSYGPKHKRLAAPHAANSWGTPDFHMNRGQAGPRWITSVMCTDAQFPWGNLFGLRPQTLAVVFPYEVSPDLYSFLLGTVVLNRVCRQVYTIQAIVARKKRGLGLRSHADLLRSSPRSVLLGVDLVLPSLTNVVWCCEMSLAGIRCAPIAAHWRSRTRDLLRGKITVTLALAPLGVTYLTSH